MNSKIQQCNSAIGSSSNRNNMKAQPVAASEEPAAPAVAEEARPEREVGGGAGWRGGVVLVCWVLGVYVWGEVRVEIAD